MRHLAIVEAGVRVDIGECCLDTDADIALAEAYADLDNDERARAAGFIFPRDRDRFVRAHGYLRRQLGAFVRMAPSEVPIVVGEGGKPFVEGRRVRFNLSHSGSRAVLAMTRDRDIGIDIEAIDRSPSFEDELDGLARLCLNADEQAALSLAPRAQRVRRFLSYWTAKEARMKVTGEGMALEPKSIALKLSAGLPVGYLRPHEPRADLLFIPLARPDTICCIALQSGDGAG